MNADAGKCHSGGKLSVALDWRSFTNKDIKDLYGSFHTNKKEKKFLTMYDIFSLKNHLITITFKILSFFQVGHGLKHEVFF